MRKVYKYGTGEEIPEGAIYLSTQVETESHGVRGDRELIITKTLNVLVWHYFLVDVK